MSLTSSIPEEANRAHWDEIAPVHLKSYKIDGLLAGVSKIDDIQKQELNPITGKDLIHLQCHIGTDTLSLALDGAHVTGVDFSEQSLEIARALCQQLNLNVEFILANVLELQVLITRKFDIVYTSMGALCWISDIEKWAETVAFLLKPGGTFYVMDTHPFFNIYDQDNNGELEIKYPYFSQPEPLHFEDNFPDYADHTYIPNTKTYEWTWSLSEIVNALIKNGLEIEFIHEYDKLFFQAYPDMVEVDDGWWVFEHLRGKIPLTFSLRARKK